MKHFVFLEFTNPKLREFLSELRFAFTKKKIAASVHITVRGPYEDPPNKDVLEPLRDKLNGFGLLINGTGIFKTKKGYVVFLKVSSPVFEEIWWKPDFKSEGINPHITMYETKKLENANMVEKFLKAERIEISTFSFTLTTYTAKQTELFEETIDAATLKRVSNFEKWNVKSGIVDRARRLATQLS